jgi:hypothetical protein
LSAWYAPEPKDSSVFPPGFGLVGFVLPFHGTVAAGPTDRRKTRMNVETIVVYIVNNGMSKKNS